MSAKPAERQVELQLHGTYLRQGIFRYGRFQIPKYNYIHLYKILRVNQYRVHISLHSINFSSLAVFWKMWLSWKHTVLTLHIASSLVEASSKRLPVVDLGYTVHQAISYNVSSSLSKTVG